MSFSPGGSGSSTLSGDSDVVLSNPIEAEILSFDATASKWKNRSAPGEGFFNVKTYGALGDGSTDDTSAIQTAINAASDAGGGTVFMPSGTYMLHMAAHPNPSGFGNCALAIKSGVRLLGAGMTRTILKLQDASSLTSGSQNRIIINWDPNNNSGPDVDITIEALTVDGNCANNGNSTTVNHGIQLWNAQRLQVLSVLVKNMRGNDTATYETFHIDFIRSQDFSARDCIVTRDDNGNTATGFSGNFSNRGVFSNCLAFNMANGHGYTLYSCANVSYVACQAYGNGANGGSVTGQGFNLEHSWDVMYTSCLSGTPTATMVNNSPPVFVPGLAQGNFTSGFNTNLTKGGGRISYVNCHSAGNNYGLAVLGARTLTAAIGTTGTTVVGPSGSFFPTDVGRFVRVNGGAWVRIASYTDSTTVIVVASHGGAAGNQVDILSGEVEWIGGDISGNSGGGVQFTDTTAALKRLCIQMTNLATARIHDNIHDLLNVGNGSISTVNIASGRATSTTTDALVSGTEFVNPFPMAMQVVVVGATGTTQIRGSYPSSLLDSTGVNSGTFTIPAGGSINATVPAASNVRWYFSH